MCRSTNSSKARRSPRWARGIRLRPDPHRPLTLEQVERAQIERALAHHAGNRTRAAKELGISRATLINKIRAYALNR